MVHRAPLGSSPRVQGRAHKCNYQLSIIKCYIDRPVVKDNPGMNMTDPSIHNSEMSEKCLPRPGDPVSRNRVPRFR